MNRKELFYLSLTIFLTIISWLIIEIYKVDLNIKSEKQEVIIDKKIEIDTSIINELKERQL